MPAAVHTPAVTPALLTWAREQSGYGIDQVASRLKVKDERVTAWEAGERQPTFKQVEALARFFRRPLSLFFLPRPPQIPPLAADYRRLPDVDPGHESPELRLALRQMLARRETTLELLEELGETIPTFDLRAHLSEKPAAVGQRLRAAIAISVATQLAWPDEWRAWAALRAAAEQIGVLVFQFGKVALKDVRGVALLRWPLPAVGINGKEVPEAKGFTLFHEVVHLMLAAGHDEAPALKEKRSSAEWADVERFAEIAASHALVPEEALDDVVQDLGLRSTSWSIPDVRRLARRFRVTPLATATRLRESGFMNWTRYKSWRADWDAYVQTLPPRKGGVATPERKALNRAGRPFVQLVLEALAADRITAVDAARHLDLRLQHFDNLRLRLAAGPGDGAEPSDDQSPAAP